MAGPRRIFQTEERPDLSDKPSQLTRFRHNTGLLLCILGYFSLVIIIAVSIVIGFDRHYVS